MFKRLRADVTALFAVFCIILQSFALMGSHGVISADSAPEAVDWWSQFQHDVCRSGFSTSSAPDTSNLIWQADQNDLYYGSYTGAVTCNGRVIATDYTGRVIALDEASGARIWMSILPGWPNYIMSTPSTDGILVYVVSCVDGDLRALSFGDGHVVWTRNIGPGSAVANYISSPAISQSAHKVVVGGLGPVPSDGPATVWAFDTSSGVLQWRFDAGVGNFYSSPAIDETGGRVYVVNEHNATTGHSQILCLSLATGKLLCYYDLPSPGQRTSPTIADGKVFLPLGSGSHGIYCFDMNLVPVWHKPYSIGPRQGAIAVANGKVYTGHDCLNEADGTLVWHIDYSDGSDYASPAIADGKMYIENSAGFCCYNADNGALIWSYAGNGMKYGSPAISNGRVFFTTSAQGGLWAFEKAGQPPYDVTIIAHCNTESADVGVSITMDGSPTGFNTTHTFNGLTGTHTFTIPSTDPTGHPLKRWSTGQTTTSIKVTSGGTYTADYEAPIGDLWITKVEAVQAIPFSAPAGLVVGKATLFNLTIANSFSSAIRIEDDVRLRVQVESISWYEGPLELVPGNNVFHTTEFWYPSGNPCDPAVFTIDPDGHLIESNEGNNAYPLTIYSAQYVYRGNFKVLYVPIGFWTSSLWGGLDPEITSQELFKEMQCGDAILKGVFPVSSQGYSSYSTSPIKMDSKDGGKLWTNLEVIRYDNILNLYRQPEQGGYDRVLAVVPSYYPTDNWHNKWLWINALGRVMRMGHDKVAWVEVGYYNTIAHELGHTYGLQPYPELTYCTRRGSGCLEEHPYLVNDCPCVMSRGDEHGIFPLRWICDLHYYELKENTKSYHDPEVLFVSGLVCSNSTVILDPFYHFTQGMADVELGSSGNYTLQFLDSSSIVIGLAGFNVTFDPNFNVTNFAFAVPYVAGAAAVQIISNGTVLAQREVTMNPPTVTVSYPNGGETFLSGENITIAWEGNDRDGDLLTYTVLHSTDNGTNWIPISTNCRETTLNWTVPNDVTSRCLIKVVATDGVNVGKDISDDTFTVLRHDIAVADIQPSQTIVEEGYFVPINITVSNHGNYTEILDLTVYANATIIGGQTLSLASGSSTTVTCTWDTAGFFKGNYAIKAYVAPIPGETDTVDNTLVSGIATVTSLASPIKVLHVSAFCYDEVQQVINIANASSLFEVAQVSLYDFNNRLTASLSEYKAIVFGMSDRFEGPNSGYPNYTGVIGRISELREYVRNGGGIVWTHDTLEYGTDYGYEVEEPAGIDFENANPWTYGTAARIVTEHEILHFPFKVGTEGSVIETLATHTTGGALTKANIIMRFNEQPEDKNKFYLAANEYQKGRVAVIELGCNTMIDPYGSLNSWPQQNESRIFVNALYWVSQGARPHEVTTTGATTLKTIVGEGYSVNTTATVQNQGDYPEAFNVTLYAQPQGSVNESNLVGCWSFEEGSGIVTYDISGNGNKGTLVNGAAWVDGRYGKAMSFDGVNDYAEITENTDLDPHTSNWTISAWVNIKRLKGPGEAGFVIVGKRQAESDHSLTLMVHAQTSETSQAKFAFIWDGPSQLAGAESAMMDVFGWHHVAGVRRGGELYVYVDGVEYGPNNLFQIGSHISPTTDVNSHTFIHLGHHGGWGRYYNGTIDEAHVYSRALSAQEVASLSAHGRFAIQRRSITLESRASAFITFTWNTSGFSKGNYIMKVYAQPVENEFNMTNNNYIGNTVLVTIAGDINGDKIVDARDLHSFGKVYDVLPDSPNWTPNADINDDLIINTQDLRIIQVHYGKSW